MMRMFSGRTHRPALGVERKNARLCWNRDHCWPGVTHPRGEYSAEGSEGNCPGGLLPRGEDAEPGETELCSDFMSFYRRSYTGDAARSSASFLFADIKVDIQNLEHWLILPRLHTTSNLQSEL